MPLKQLTSIIGLAFALLLSSGCASVNARHPDFAEAPGADVANVYFIRPIPVLIHPYADAAVNIEFDGEKLLKLNEGVYTLIYLKPSKGTLKISNNSLFTNRIESQKVWKESQYRFIAGRTYFIHIAQKDEEFRGIFYTAELVHLNEAKRLAKSKGMRRFGTAASAHPINNVSDAYEAPDSAVKEMGPTLPEQLYQQEDYMLKKKN